MAITTRPEFPRALGDTRRWIEAGSRSAALWARAQHVMPSGNTRTTVHMAPPYAASGERCRITDVEGERRWTASTTPPR